MTSVKNFSKYCLLKNQDMLTLQLMMLHEVKIGVITEKFSQSWQLKNN